MSVAILQGDVLVRLRELPDNSVHCVVTSPPYWGLRDYGVAGQIGMEPTYREHISVLVEVFREVRRVLRADGTCWMNYGDCWASSPNGRPADQVNSAGGDDRVFRDKPFSTVGGGLKPKDLCMMPHRIAIALQEDGWWVRDDIVWHKPNPMPSSVKDRPTPAKEYVFLLSKSPRYFYDHVAIMEPLADPSAAYKSPDGWNTGDGAHGSFHPHGREKGRPSARNNFRREGALKMSDVPGQKPQIRDDRADTVLDPRGRNKRDVWTISTEPFKDAHFATFPTALVEPCILAGTSAKGVCPHCGAPWKRIVRSEFVLQEDAPNSACMRDGQTDAGTRWAGSTRGTVNHETEGWEKACACAEHAPIPATVLDPFGGAGTTGLVADRLGRNAILIELNQQSVDIAKRRISSDAGLFGIIRGSAA